MPNRKLYEKCDKLNESCEWRLGKKHDKGYEYLDNACYLAGCTQCPINKINC